MPMCELNFASFFSRFHIIESLSFKEYLLGLQKYCYLYNIQFSTVQLLSCVRLCDPIDCTTPGFLVHHQLLELAQTQVHWVSPSPTPGACSNSSPSSQWCHPTILASVIPFSCLQSFPASGSFPTSQFFKSGGQNIGASGSTSVLPISVQDWFDLFAVQGTLKSLLQHHSAHLFLSNKNWTVTF